MSAAAGSSSESRTITVPTGSGESIVIPLDELPQDASEMVEVLNAISAPFTIWHEIALEYFHHGHHKSYETIVDKALQMKDPLVLQRAWRASAARAITA